MSGDSVTPQDDENVPSLLPTKQPKKRVRGSGFLVRIQDPHGKVTTTRLSVQEAHNLPSGHKVEVDILGRTDQPTGQGGELFSRFCISIGKNFERFPIDPLDWRKVDEKAKNLTWYEIVKEKFLASEVLKGWGIAKMGDGWKNNRNDYFKDRNRGGSRPYDELVQDVPSGVPPDAWARYVEWRRGEIGQKRSKQGVHARAHQVVQHTHGTKLFSVGYGEMEEEAARKGRQVTYGQFYAIYHRHKDGTPISDAAEEQIARIIEAEREINESQKDNVDSIASLRVALGSGEHPGRVRGLGFGARSNRVYGCAREASSSQANPNQPSSSGERMVDLDYEDRLRAQLRGEIREQMREEMREQITEEREQLRVEKEQLRKEREQLSKEREELREKREDIEGCIHDVLGKWIQSANSALQQAGVQLPLPPRPQKKRRQRSPRSEPDEQQPSS